MTLEAVWHKHLVKVRMKVGRGVKPEVLMDRYDANSEGEIEVLVTQAKKEVIRKDNEKIALDDLDRAEQKLAEAGNYTLAVSGDLR